MWRHQLKLNAIVFIWSFTAILGQWITLPRFELVFLRTFFAGLFLYGFWRWWHGRRRSRRAWPRRTWRLLANGAVVGLHWVLFFSAAELNASVCLAGYATTTLWTALLEPLITRSPWRRREIFLGVVIAAALIYLYQAETGHVVALMLGLGSAIAAAVFSILNGQWARGEDAVAVTILEMVGASIFCLVAAFGRSSLQGTWPEFWPSPMDWLWLAVLVIFCTAYAYAAYIQLLRYLSVFAINLAANFEPVYGMILAAILLNEAEELTPGFYGGSVVILLCVLSYTWMTRRQVTPGLPASGA